MRGLLLLAVALALVLSVACDGASGGDGTPDAGDDASPTSAPTVTPGPNLSIFVGYTVPIEGACLPTSDQLMPNAPREYRGGVHEGVDFYEDDNCVAIDLNTPALAVKDGVVIRADHIYHDLTQQELADAEQRIADGHPDDPQVLDLFRGRQVWIDHGDGIVSRYAHLEGIPQEVRQGERVVQGQVVGLIGDSGTPESLSAPNTEIHLHWELRVRDTFLGVGLPPEEVRATYETLFAPTEPE